MIAKPCPYCGNEPIIISGFPPAPPGYYVFADITCLYKTWPKQDIADAELEWDTMRIHVTKWMIDGKHIRYGVMDRFLEDAKNETEKG